MKAFLRPFIYFIAALSCGYSGLYLYMMAQAWFESGDWKSDVYKENKNPFGMRFPQLRPTTAIGENRGYAVYRNEFQAVRDLCKWLKYHNAPKSFPSPGHYTEYLKSKNYYEGDPMIYGASVTFEYDRSHKKWKRNVIIVFSVIGTICTVAILLCNKSSKGWK